MRIDAIYIAPVKSLALTRLERAHVGQQGIDGDRRFFLVDTDARVFTQREFGALVQVRSNYDVASRRLRFDFPDGAAIEDEVGTGDPIAGNFYGDDFKGSLAPGPWDRALSSYAGQPLRLVHAADMAFDVLPVSLCSAASVQEVQRRADQGVDVDERRFRPNLYVGGLAAHGEDAWVGQRIRVGHAAIVNVQMLDTRCVVTTHDPRTGDVDMNTLKLIASYRTDQPKEVNFGVYGSVEREGDIAIGDEVTPLEEAAS